MPGPLHGVRIIDLTAVLLGPFATQHLADMGADVIKIEPPRRGENSRSYGPFVDGESLYTMVFNRNKRSLSLDLRTDRGKQLLRDLLRKASAGFPCLSLTALLAEQSLAANTNLMAAKPAHHRPRAKSVIFLFMGGGPSQVDLFDPKPKLADYANEKIPIKLPRITRDSTPNCRPSPYRFRRHGEAGIVISEL